MLRSVYPLVLGLGGWCVGAVSVLTTMLGVRLDNELLVLSVGVPIGLATYWARVPPTAPSKCVGLAAAAAGALAGARLGFHATGGLLAILTVIVEALAGANLALLVLDISRVARTTSADAPSPALEPVAEVRSS